MSNLAIFKTVFFPIKESEYFIKDALEFPFSEVRSVRVLFYSRKDLFEEAIVVEEVQFLSAFVRNFELEAKFIVSDYAFYVIDVAAELSLADFTLSVHLDDVVDPYFEDTISNVGIEVASELEVDDCNE